MGLPVQNVSSSSTWRRWFPTILVLGSVVSLYWGWLALPIGFGCFIAAVTLEPLRIAGARWAGSCILVAALVVSGGLARFVVVEGMSGIVRGGRQAVQRKAVSKLREILFAQDAVRRMAWIDADRDGIGSTAFLEELCAGKSTRSEASDQAPVLRCARYVSSDQGGYTQEGAYLFKVCLPAAADSWQSHISLAVDEERAETQFVAYAWPAPHSGFETAFFIDERENIRTRAAPTLTSKRPNSERTEQWQPDCAEALRGDSADQWQVWRGKKPRSEAK